MPKNRIERAIDLINEYKKEISLSEDLCKNVYQEAIKMLEEHINKYKIPLDKQ